jgi:hypothetical protein
METAVKIPGAKTSAPENVNARAFAAGTGVTAALVTAAIVVFASIAAYVGFEGMPFSGGDSADSTVSLRTGAPQAAALAAGSTAAAVADDPARPSAAALAEIAAALPPGATDSVGPGSGPGGGTPDDPATGGGDPGLGAGPVAPTDPGVPGPLQNTVGAVDDAAGGLGVDLPLNEVTDPVTQEVDDTVGGTLNNVGGNLGAGNLGDNVNGTLNGVTGGLLGGN